MLHREMLYLSRDRFDILRAELWELTRPSWTPADAAFSTRTLHSASTTSGLARYFALCRSNGNPNLIENFYQRVAPNEELRGVARRRARSQL